MQLGMIGLGRMGGSMVHRVLRGGHACVVFDSQPATMAPSANQGATATHSLEEFVRTLQTPRVVWLMLPAAVVDPTLGELSRHLQSGDIVVDGGNYAKVLRTPPKGVRLGSNANAFTGGYRLWEHHA